MELRSVKLSQDLCWHKPKPTVFYKSNINTWNNLILFADSALFTRMLIIDILVIPISMLVILYYFTINFDEC
ncbi:MAG: hypothetical protein ACTHL3_09305, partial [Candidatus Nitrosocosmicus sp.]